MSGIFAEKIIRSRVGGTKRSPFEVYRKVEVRDVGVPR